MYRSNFGQSDACASQAQDLAQAQAALGQASAMVSVDGGAALARANQQVGQAAQAFQQCQANPPSTAAQNITAAAPIIGSLASLGTGIASLFMRKPATTMINPATPVIMPQQNNTTMILAIAGIVIVLIVVVMLMRK